MVVTLLLLLLLLQVSPAHLVVVSAAGTTMSVPFESLQGDPSRWPKPPVDFKSKVPIWPGLAALAWPGQSGTLLLKSTGGFGQRDGSPCTNIAFQICQILTFFNLDADRPKVGAVEHALVGASEARDGRPVDVVFEQPPLWTLVRDVGPRGNRSWDP